MSGWQEDVDLWLALAALVAALAAFYRWAWPRLKRAATTVTNGLVTLGGRDAIVDSVTGRELAPAQPALGVRLDRFEQGQTDAALALGRIATLFEGQQKQDSRIDSLEAHRVDDVGRIVALETARLERTVSQLDSAAAWTAFCTEHGEHCEAHGEQGHNPSI